MHRSAVQRTRSASVGAVAVLIVHEQGCDRELVSMPRAEIHVVARFGGAARDGLDVHAMGARQSVRRKLVRGGQRTVAARLPLGTAERVLGVSAAAIAGRVVALEELWRGDAARRLRARLATARDGDDAAAIIEGAVAERLMGAARDARAQLAVEAAARLVIENVNTVAGELGVSERHLRRVFRDVVGMSPKAFARLARFQRALQAARERSPASWGRIAAATGYYDQAHLIDEFRTIAGVTPRALLGELSASGSRVA